MSKTNPLAIILGLSLLFFIIFLVVVSSVLISVTGVRPEKKMFSRTNQIGVIEVKGVIIDSKKILDQVETFSEDSKVKAVLVRINSPGGAVAPSQEIYDAFRRLGKKKPVFSSMASVAASGGYYVACGTKKIFASPGTITGSIGVIMQFADMSKLYQWAKVSLYNIKTGKFKDIGSPAREMSQDEKNLLQAMVDNVLGQFRSAITTGRGLPMEKVVELSDGRIFSGEQAKHLKLVDELGGMNEAVEALAREAGITGKPVLVYAHKGQPKWMRFLSDVDDDADAESKLASGSLLESMLGRLFASVLRLPASSERAAQQADLIGPLFLMPRAY